MASVLTDRENNALRAGSLLAVPLPPLGSQPLAGSTTFDLLGNSLTQWATHVQDVTSGMILPPEVAVNCPQADIVGVLNRLEGLTRVQYCRHCFGVSQKCWCSAIPHQAPGPTLALWTPPMVSYVTMISSTETTASTSALAMDTLPAPTTENLLATAAVTQQQVPTPRRQESTQATPYQQQVYPPQHTTGVGCATPKLITTPSASQGHEEPAREDEDARGRSSSRGPQR